MPLFVTWYKAKKDKYKLAGCIGTFSANKALNKLIGEYSVIAATEDDRFSPITKEEISKLKVGLSLLTNFKTEPLSNPLDWVVGKHGVEIKV